MAITIKQRLSRLQVRLRELRYWCDYDYVDLSDWRFGNQPLHLGAAWPSREGVVQLSHPQISLPAGWPVEQSWLELEVGGEGLLRVCYEDGSHEAFGLDPMHRRFPLRRSTFWLEVTAVARLPFGVPNRDARLQRARVVWVDAPVERLIRLLELVIETGLSLNDIAREEIVERLVTFAERAINSLDWPSGTAGYLARIAESSQLQHIWETPADLAAHPPGLTDRERASVVAATDGLEEALLALRERYPAHGRLAVTGHAHLDLAWLWPLAETRRKAQRSFYTVLSLLDSYPEMRFNQSSAQLYSFIQEDDPKLFEQIREKVKAGQWEPIGGMWVETDCNMPSGEALTRQLLYGQRFFQQAFGFTPNVAWLPDCFGFTPALPQILLGAGIENFFTIKLTWSETNTFPYDLFWWEGLDGSRVLAHMFDNPGNPHRQHIAEPGVGGYNGRPDPFSVLTTWRNFRGKHLFPESLFSIGYGDGGGGPSREMVEIMRQLEAFPELPSTRFTLVRDFYQRLRDGVVPRDVPTWAGELYLELHRGTLTTQGRTKYLHRRAERDLVAAEVVSAMTMLQGAPDVASLEPAWQVVLRNEFHDILPGSSIREVYETAEAELSSVIASAGEVMERRLGELAERLVSAGDRPALLVVNPDLSERPLRVECKESFPGAQPVDGGYVLSGKTAVPSLGASVIVQPEAASPVTVTSHTLENEYLLVTLDEDGTPASVWDKRVEREVLRGRGNQLWAYVDKPRNWEAWDIDVGYTEAGQEIRSVASMKVVEEGPHRGAIRVERRFRDSRITQDIRLWANSARLEFKTAIDWHDRRWLLKARFPLAVRARQATFETAFGVVQRATHRNTTWESAQFEAVAHRFADLSEPGYGVALLNDGKYGHDVLEDGIALSLLRSPVHPDPYADEGTQIFTYALYPHLGSWLDGGVLMEAEDLNRPLLVRNCTAGSETTWRAVEIHGSQLGLGTLKVLEDGSGLVLRTYEPEGAAGRVELSLPAGWAVSEEVDLLEQTVGPADFAVRPFGLHSWVLRREES